MDNVECRKCGESKSTPRYHVNASNKFVVGHFSKDCDKPETCINCGEEGHKFFGCPKPKDCKFDDQR